MSKLQLKKELKQLSREQLEQLVIEAYDARKEVKEYFDFFLNPDVDRLMEKYKTAIVREFARSKRGSCKARISVIKKNIKEFESFHPGFDKELELLKYVVDIGLLAEQARNFNDTLTNGVMSVMLKLVDLADRNLVADRVLADLTATLSREHAGTRYFRRFLRNALDTYRPQQGL